MAPRNIDAWRRLIEVPGVDARMRRYRAWSTGYVQCGVQAIGAKEVFGVLVQASGLAINRIARHLSSATGRGRDGGRVISVDRHDYIELAARRLAPLRGRNLGLSPLHCLHCCP